MPKLSDSLPKYRKHRATGQAVVTLSGRYFYLGPHGTRASRLEYDRLIGEWLQNGRTAGTPLPVSGYLCIFPANQCVRFRRAAHETETLASTTGRDHFRRAPGIPSVEG